MRRFPAVVLFAWLWCGCGEATGSIGAVLGRDNQTKAVHVREAPPGMAAARAGLLPGDEVVMIEGYYVQDLTPKQIQSLLRGDPGTKVELTVVRNGQVRRVQLTRTPLREKKLPKEETEDKQEVEE